MKFVNNKDCYEDFGNFVKEKRLRAGMFQSEVAEKLNITQSYLSRIEAGQREVDLVFVFNLCAVLGADINEFIKRYAPENAK